MLVSVGVIFIFTKWFTPAIIIIIIILNPILKAIWVSHCLGNIACLIKDAVFIKDTHHKHYWVKWKHLVDLHYQEKQLSIARRAIKTRASPSVAFLPTIRFTSVSCTWKSNFHPKYKFFRNNYHTSTAHYIQNITTINTVVNLATLLS